MPEIDQLTSLFSTLSFGEDVETSVILTIAAIAGVGVLYFLLRLLFKRKQHPLPTGHITDPATIRRILHDAIVQRSTFELQIIVEEEGRRPSLRCVPEGIGLEGVSLEATGISSLSDRWLNRTVNIFFHPKQPNGEPVYFSFTSHIVKISTSKADFCIVTLAFPTEIHDRQKRSYLRIIPPSQYVCGAALWFGNAKPAMQNLHDISLWPRPILLSMPTQIEQFQIQNFSASGIRLMLPHKTLQQYGAEASSIDSFFVMLDLIDPVQECLARFWLQCQTQNITIEPHRNETNIGAKFISWGRPKKPDINEFSSIQWLRLSKADVEPLGSWIMLRHLEMFRDLHDSENRLE